MLNGSALFSGEHRREYLLVAASLTLTVVATGCIIAGLYGASLDLSDYGLVSSFPPTFLVGLALLPLASSFLWFTRRKIDGIIVAQLLVLIAALWLSPYLIESTARFRASYKNFGAVDSLLRGEGLASDEVIYHNWPLFPAGTAALTKVTGIEPTQLMGTFPFVMQVAYLIPLVALLRVLPRSDNRWWAGVWFFYLFNWTGQDYYSPQAFAFLLFLILIAVFARVASQGKGELTGLTTTVTLALCIAIVLTHFLTAALVLAVMAALTAGGVLRRWSLVLTAAMILVAWQTYGAYLFFSLQNERILDSLLDPADFFNLNVGNRLAGSPAHTVVGRLRMLMTGLAFALAGASLLIHGLGRRGLTVFARRRLNQDGLPAGLRESLEAAMASVTGARSLLERGMSPDSSEPAKSRPTVFSALTVRFALLLLLALFIAAPLYAYGGEILIRVLLFSLPALAFLVAWAASSRTVVLVAAALLVPIAPVHFATHYGNEAYDYVSQGELDGFEFVAEELAPANVFGGYPAGAFKNVRQLDWRHAVVAGKDKLPSVDDYLHPDELHWEHEDRPIYVVLGRGDDAGARLFYNQRDFLQRVTAAVNRSGQFKLVFDNEDIAIYRWCGQCDEADETVRRGTPARAALGVAEGESWPP